MASGGLENRKRNVLWDLRRGGNSIPPGGTDTKSQQRRHHMEVTTERSKRESEKIESNKKVIAEVGDEAPHMQSKMCA